MGHRPLQEPMPKRSDKEHPPFLARPTRCPATSPPPISTSPEGPIYTPKDPSNLIIKEVKPQVLKFTRPRSQALPQGPHKVLVPHYPLGNQSTKPHCPQPPLP